MVFAAEVGVSYATVAVVTDDCLRDPGKAVNIAAFLEVMNNNVGYFKNVVVRALEMLAKMRWSETVEANEAKAKGKHRALKNRANIFLFATNKVWHQAKSNKYIFI